VADYAARVILHRAPEVADAVMPVEVFAGVVEVIDLLSERLAALSEALDGPQIKPAGKTSATIPQCCRCDGALRYRPKILNPAAATALFRRPPCDFGLCLHGSLICAEAGHRPQGKGCARDLLGVTLGAATKANEIALAW
jgi:hypothetical protein